MYLGKRISDQKTGQWGPLLCFSLEYLIFVVHLQVMMLLLKHTGTGKGEVLCILYWTDSVCEDLSVWIVVLCLQFLCFQTFPLCSSFVPLDSFVLTFVTNREHFLAWLFSVSLYFQYKAKVLKLTSILVVFSQFAAGEYLLYKRSYWSKFARLSMVYRNKKSTYFQYKLH